MSEYQYHEWQAVDSILTPEEQAAVNDLSSHIEVSPSRAVVTYHWSDFRHDLKQVLLKYFDAYFYLANWGSLQLMFRFPKGMLDEDDIEPYCIDGYITFETIGKYQVLDLDFSPEYCGSGWMAAEADLAHFIRLRVDLLECDYRLLYLAWLKAMTFKGNLYDDEEYEDNDPDHAEFDREPPVPPGLKILSPSLRNFVQVFEIDPYLVQAATEASPDLKKVMTVDYRELIGRLPRSGCDDFLVRLAESDPGVGLALRKRLGAFQPQERPQPARRRTIQQLLQYAEQLEKAEKERQAEAAHQMHIAEMKALVEHETQVWQQVETLLDTGHKIAAVYDEATGMLEKLKLLSEFKATRDIFHARLQKLAQKYISRPSLIDRWKKRGWV
jgi:hypothetical protein